MSKLTKYRSEGGENGCNRQNDTVKQVVKRFTNQHLK